MRATRRLCTAGAASSQSRSAPQAGSPSSERSGDRAVRDARARERARELGHAAGRAVREPLARRHRLVVERARRLQVEDHDRRLRGLHDGQHLGRRGVGRRVDASRGRRAPRRALARLARAPAACRRGRPRRRPRPAPASRASMPALVALEPLAQALELRPVRGEADAEHADPRRRAAPHPVSRLRPRRWRRAPALRSRSARAPVDVARCSGRSRSRAGGRRRRCSDPGPGRGRAVIAVCRQPRTATARTTPTIVPRPPKIEIAAEQDDRDDEQLQPDARVVAGGGEPERPEDAGEPAQQPGEDEEPELDPLDADAREERRLLTGADREDRPTERRRVQDDAEDDRQHDEERDRARDLRAAGSG